MRKFSKILALLLAVSLIGGALALTASAEVTPSLAISGTGAGGATPSMNRYYSFKSSDVAPAKTSTKYGSNLFQPNGFYTYATNEIVTDASGNTYYKATGSTNAKNMYAFISASSNLSGGQYTSDTLYQEENLINNVVVTEFDICAFDVDGDGIADWNELKLIGGYVACESQANKADGFIGQNFSSLITDTTPGKWHHISIIATWVAGSSGNNPYRTCAHVYVDGVYYNSYTANQNNNSTGTGLAVRYYHIGASANALTGDWSIGLDNIAVNSYNVESYASAEAATNTLANVIANNSYKTMANLSDYTDAAYYTETYAPFDPNPAVATVDGVKYSTLGEALANLTDGKTLVTELPIENYTPVSGVNSVMIQAPSVTLSEDAKAAGFKTATWLDNDDNVVATAVCQPGAEVTHPVLDGALVPDEQNVYYGWCKSVYGYSANATDVVTDDVVFTPDACVPYEADIKGIMYNVNLDTSFDIAVYVPIRYTQNENGKYELATVLPEGFEFDTVTGGSTNEGYVAVGADEEGNVLYSPCYSRRISMRKVADSYTPVFSFSIGGREFTYTMPTITIGTYAAAVYENTECGEKDAVLITAMLNYVKSYEYENLTSNGTPSKATFAIYAAVNSKQNNDDLTPGEHHNCACQEKLREYAANAYQNEMGILDGSEYQINDLFRGFTMHVNYNEPSIGVIVDSTKIGAYSTTAGEGLINAYRYTYTNYRGQKVSQVNLIKGAAEAGGWDDYITYDGGVMLKCNNIYVLDVIGTVEIELLTCTEVNEASPYDSTFETLDSAKYSVAEYYQWLSTEAAKENAPAEYGLYVQNLIDLYALAKAAKDYRIK